MQHLSHLMLVGLLALVFDWVFGDPDWLWRRLPHPVVLFGRAIACVEKIANQSRLSSATRRFLGIIVIFFLVAVAAAIGFLLAIGCQWFGFVGMVIEAGIASIFLAQRSLIEHVRAVRVALEGQILAQARCEVAKIVGRNSAHLDEAGIARATLESLAENSSDGVVAPLFWLLLFGLPGIFAYKMLNTADSMIGHKSERFRDFGFAAAKADDIANYLAARLCALITLGAVWIKYGSSSVCTAWHVMRQDAKQHQSPNAGWPETVYAGALGVNLAGPRRYGEIYVNAAFQNAQGRDPNAHDIDAALSLFRTSMGLSFILILTALSVYLLLFLT